MTAEEYVAKNEMPSLMRAAIAYDNRSFLPSPTDARMFCEHYGFEMPKGKSRAAVMPHIFKFLATMDLDEVTEILDYESFGGPTKLGPIADAILGRGKHGKQADFDKQT